MAAIPRFKWGCVKSCSLLFYFFDLSNQRGFHFLHCMSLPGRRLIMKLKRKIELRNLRKNDNALTGRNLPLVLVPYLTLPWIATMRWYVAGRGEEGDTPDGPIVDTLQRKAYPEVTLNLKWNEIHAYRYSIRHSPHIHIRIRTFLHLPSSLQETCQRPAQSPDNRYYLPTKIFIFHSSLALYWRRIR